MMRTKLIAVDMDGTFLRSDNTYDKARFKEIYSKLKEKDIRFTVASGNQYFQLKDFFPEYSDIIYVSENGALIRDNNHIYSLHAYPDEAVNKIEQFLDKQDRLQFLVCGAQSAYEPKKFGQDYYNRMYVYYHHLKQINNFDEINDQIVKFAVQCNDEDTQYFIDLFKKELAPYADVTSSGHGDIDIIQPGIHKANGLKELGNILNISLNEMAAFGDGNNDLEMIREVGDGVAVENASSDVLKAAKHITGTNNRQGVLTYIEKNILQ
ncbi:Cof subfamily protein (haloacid dehalogenase superfamily) [Lactobacillus colini]|uniref:Cof subfamily protein (Haloacid dehalogenase superfamily) n=1 Tax=Lactobacillus colini TaxID=1819254 RepID=A0ABS4MG78_9LACO|nr:Cof-type HAD-IIB family hydrolase [Lactobacillus colini]MBP2058685.1 Cof subfamily protein (haloacid dehalogenase superfamily) [Lactobacillus colini]